MVTYNVRFKVTQKMYRFRHRQSNYHNQTYSMDNKLHTDTVRWKSNTTKYGEGDIDDGQVHIDQIRVKVTATGTWSRSSTK